MHIEPHVSNNILEQDVLSINSKLKFDSKVLAGPTSKMENKREISIDKAHVNILSANAKEICNRQLAYKL